MRHGRVSRYPIRNSWERALLSQIDAYDVTDSRVDRNLYYCDLKDVCYCHDFYVYVLLDESDLRFQKFRELITKLWYLSRSESPFTSLL